MRQTARNGLRAVRTPRLCEATRSGVARYHLQSTPPSIHQSVHSSTPAIPPSTWPFIRFLVSSQPLNSSTFTLVSFLTGSLFPSRLLHFSSPHTPT
ncbi:unnamed protein product, partial [Protopolystoma xenopodis]